MTTTLFLIPGMKFCFETRSLPTLSRCFPSQLYLLCRSSRSLHSTFYFHTFFLFETRATNSSNLESNNFRMGDWFDFL
jgi:hypothetical protein